MDSKRIGAFIIDYIMGCVIVALVMLKIVVLPVLEGTFTSQNSFKVFITVFAAAWAYFLIKDLPHFGSIGKNCLKIKIVNSSDFKDSNIGRRLLRNVTWCLGPVEVIVYCICKKRLGDMLAGTTVISLDNSRQ